MSVELIALAISTATLMLGFVAAFGWMVSRMDRGFAQLRVEIGTTNADLSTRIEGVETRLTERIDGVETRLTERIEGVERGLVDVKIAIARLEGPPPRLITAR